MKKDILIIFAVILLVVFVVCGANIQTVDEYYMTHMEDITDDSPSVTVEIRCDSILKNYDKLDDNLKSEKYIPKDGVILEKTKYALRYDDTAFDMLMRVTQYNKIQMEYQGTDLNNYGSVYIKGINNIYEFSCGPLSGWTYTVNGKTADCGCSSYKLKDGDALCWVYTCNLGNDINGGIT